MIDALLQADRHLAELQALHVPLGAHAPVVAAAFAAHDGWIVTGPRGRVGATLRGCPVAELREHDLRQWRVASPSDRPGVGALHAVGLALHTGAPVLCLLGLASAAHGALHEALNVAVLTGAPVVYLVTTVPLDEDAPVSRQLAASPVALATAHGLAARQVAVDALPAALSAALTAEGPQLLQVDLHPRT